MARKASSHIELVALKNQEIRWRLLARKSDFLKDLGRLQRTLYKRGNVPDADLERVADKWGVPRIPWEAIMYYPGTADPRNPATLFLESCGLQMGMYPAGVSYAPVAVHEIKKGRFVILMADLEHEVNNLVLLLRKEIIRVKQSLARRMRSMKRKHLSRIHLILPFGISGSRA